MTTIQLQRQAPVMKEAIQLYQAGNLKQARVKCRKQLRKDANNFVANFLLGIISIKKNDLDNAELYLKKATEINQQSEDAFNNLGVVYRSRGKFQQALDCFEHSRELNPKEEPPYLNIVDTAIQFGDYQSALKAIDGLLSIDPNNANAYVKLGVMLKAQSRVRKSLAMYQKALELDPENIEAHQGIVNYCNDQGHFEIAEKHLDIIRRLEPENPGHTVGLAAIYESMGKYQKAFELLHPLRVKYSANEPFMLLYSSVISRLGKKDEAIKTLEILRANEANTPKAKMAVSFQLARLYDSLNEYEIAWSRLSEANQLKGAVWDYEEDAAIVRNMLHLFNANNYPHFPDSGDASSLPVFIIGTPRSGTSLTEKIIDSHPKAYGAGELHKMNGVINVIQKKFKVQTFAEAMQHVDRPVLSAISSEYIEDLKELAPSAERVVDKMPHNIMNVGVIRMLFPSASIIHCRRHPLDACFSMYMQNFTAAHPYSFDLKNLGKFYRLYWDMMKHWQGELGIKVLDFPYERLISDQLNMSKSLIEYVGLDWDENCLSFYESSNVTSTASRHQVTKKIYNKSVARWLHYKSQLAPLMDEIGDIVEQYESEVPESVIT